MKKVFYLFLLALSTQKVISQITIDTAYFYLDTTSNFYFPKQKVHISEIMSNNLGVFKTKPTYNYLKASEFTFEGVKYMKYDQYLNNIKINGNSHFIASVQDTIINIGGKVLSNQLSIPGGLITSSSAIQTLTSSLNCFKYKWQDSILESEIKEEKDDSLATNYPIVKLNIYKTPSNNFDNVNEYDFAYPIYISALKTARDSIYFDSLYYVSAITGNITKRVSPFQNSLPPTNHDQNLVSEKKEVDGSVLSSLNSCNNSCNQTGVSIHYYGGQNINTSEFIYLGNCTNRLKQNCSGATIYTRRKANNNNVDYRSDNNSWPNQNDKVGITGHWCIEKTYEAYQNLFGFNSFDNQFSQVNVVIQNALGARWNEEEGKIYVGKFQGTVSYMAVLDIMAHEYGHAVMNKSSGLGAPASDFSNITALNIIANEVTLSEGFGDIFGQLVEYYVNSNYITTGAINDFVQGGNHPSGYQCGQTRSFINPGQTCNPNTILGSNWLPPLTANDDEDDFQDLVHRNSTVLSHWFYLLSQGGTGTSDAPFFNNYCVNSIGQVKAGKIAFLTATYFITNYNKNYNGVRLATIQAATQLYGANSHEVAQVTAAWYAVGVGNQYNGQIDQQNLTINSQYDVHYNAKVSLQNVAVNNGPLYVTSNTEIELLPNVNVNQGSFADLHIAPACSGGARFGNTGGQNNNLENELNPIKNETEDLLSREKTFLVIPNPTTGLLKLKTDNSLGYPNKIIVRDAMGRNVKVIDLPSSFEIEFNIENENAGIYMISIYYTDKVISKKVIKQ